VTRTAPSVARPGSRRGFRTLGSNTATRWPGRTPSACSVRDPVRPSRTHPNSPAYASGVSSRSVPLRRGRAGPRRQPPCCTIGQRPPIAGHTAAGKRRGQADVAPPTGLSTSTAGQETGHLALWFTGRVGRGVDALRRGGSSPTRIVRQFMPTAPWSAGPRPAAKSASSLPAPPRR